MTDQRTAFHPVTADRWPDLDRLFSESAGEELGNPSRCWCMEWRLASHRAWREGAGEANREGMRRWVGGGDVPGILAYVDGKPAGWCSVSPKSSLVGFRQPKDFPQAGGSASRGAATQAVWSVICFYVPEAHRGQGLMGRLLLAAVTYAKANGAQVIEGYPFVPEKADDGAGGTTAVFERAGFERVRELLPGQWLMRR